MNAVLELTEKNFAEQALHQQGLVLVDFSAKWCGPCQALGRELEAAAAELQGRVTIVKVDVDDSPNVAMQYGVQGIPNLTFLKEGVVVDVVVGAMPRSAIVERIKRNL